MDDDVYILSPLRNEGKIMGMKAKTILTFFISYISQVGVLWGLLDGYTYFKGDTLKTLLQGYWVFIYIIPIFTTIAYIKIFRVGESSGGQGGDAEVIGDGEANGGKGGHSGTFGPGGKGGNARVVGSGKAKGGAGGKG